MTIAVAQHTYATTAAFGTAASIVTSGVNTSGASTLVICVGTKGTISSVSDSFGNTYTLKETGSGYNTVAIYVCDGGTVGSGHTATVNFSAATAGAIFFEAITGSANPSFDVGANGSNVSDITTPTGAAVTTTNANDLVLSFIDAYSGGSTVTDSGTGFSILDSCSGSGLPTAAVSTNTTTVTGTYQDSYTFSVADYYAFATIALKAAAVAPPVVPGPLPRSIFILP